MNTDLFPPVVDKQSAYRHLKRLVLMGLDYHPDDDAETIINVETGQLLFSTAEAELMNERMTQVCLYDKDPCETILDIYEVLEF